jgi:hypothetical protein
MKTNELKIQMMKWVALCIFVTYSTYSLAAANDAYPIFPIPTSIEVKPGTFIFDNNTYLLLPPKASKEEEMISRLFVHELTDRYGYALSIRKKSSTQPGEKYVMIGTLANPLLHAYADQVKVGASLKALGREGYILMISVDRAVVMCNSMAGAWNGLASLRQLLRKESEQLTMPQLKVTDKPAFPFRGIKLYLPGRSNIPFFKNFISDFASLYKFNKIILELNANMRLDRHPELNIGAVEFARHLKYSRLDRPPGVHKEYQNSSHQDNADGQILEKEEVADLVAFIRKFGIEVIPELPSLTHSYYLLSAHRELAENLNQPYPDTYCPQKPAIYNIYFDVLDEYIDVIHPSMIHVGHDEWRMEKDLCSLCRGKDYGDLYAADLTKIHNYLQKKGIKTAIWGDHLLESVTLKDHQTWKSSTGYQYNIPGALRPEQVRKNIPKDIVIFNWFWNDSSNDRQLAAFGFQQVYGNLRPEITSISGRKKISGILGGAPSSWAASTAFNIGKDQIYDFLTSANILWSTHQLRPAEIAVVTEPLISTIYNRLTGILLPSDAGSQISPLDISGSFNTVLNNELHSTKINAAVLQTGHVTYDLRRSSGNNVVKVTSNGIASVSSSIPVHKDVSSILFLHASTAPAKNEKAYARIYDFEETAELLGWYEVIYEDGYVETVPIRYGVNILDWRWKQRLINDEKEKVKYSQDKYAWEAKAVPLSADDSDAVTFFSFEWENPHFGKKVKEVKLHGREGNSDANAVLLLSMSVSENEPVAAAKGTEAQ